MALHVRRASDSRDGLLSAVVESEPLTEREQSLPHRLFEQTVDRHASRVALDADGVTLSYEELDRRANQLAHRLRARGVRRGTHVGLMLARDIDAVVGLLAILKAGAAYVPIDPECPSERVAQIAYCCDMQLMLSHLPLAAVAESAHCEVMLLDAERSFTDLLPSTRIPLDVSAVQPSDPAYAIFTSGSTGAPKGVSISQRSLALFARAEASVFEVRPEDRVYQGFSLAFDASVEELWLAFFAGATLVIGSASEVRSGPDLPARLSARRVTVLSTVPTLLATFEEDVPSLRLLILGGEACPASLVERWARPGRRMVNTYGPTEATVVTTYADMHPSLPVTIGRPLPGYRVYVMDAQQRELPPGEAGELCISGAGLALGYLDNPTLTAARFLANPRADGPDTRLLYRTGDLCRFDASGALEFLGRIDDQVKLRGYRIELSEIEGALRDVEGVLDAAVALQTEPNAPSRLVGHVVLQAGTHFDEAAARAQLRRSLPAYMVPLFLEPIARLPTLTSGKLDRKALPRVERAGELAAEPDGAPEARILREFRRALEHPTLGLDDDFFAAGGHSLLVAQVVSRLRAQAELGALTIADIYAHPTARRAAAALEARPEHAGVDPVRLAARSRTAFTLAQLASLYPIIAAHAGSWMTPYVVYAITVDPAHFGARALLWSLLTMIAVTPLQFALAIAAKWLLLGRVRAGSHRLGGFYHFRFWLASCFLDIAPIERLAGSPLLASYLRLLGARIGEHTLLWSDSFHAFDLLQIGDGTSVGHDARIRCYQIEAGWLHLGEVRIGARCYVGARAVLAPDTRMEDGSSLDELASLSEGKQIPSGERWVGSPARAAPHQPRDQTRAQTALCTPSWPRTAWLAYALGVLLLPCLQWFALAPGLILLYRFTTEGASVGSIMLGALLVAPVYVLSFALLVAAAKWSLLGRVRAGVYPVHGALYVRKWYVDQLMDACLDLLGPLYATLYLNPWYRLLGARIEPRAELSTAASTCPDLLHLGSESFVADAVSLGVPRYDLGQVTLAETRIGARAFVGNSAVVPSGTELGACSLLGVLSLAPEQPELARRENATWLGAPAFALPARQISHEFDEHTTYQPTRKLYATRLAYEYLRITLPATCAMFLACELLAALNPLAAQVGLLLALATVPVLYAAFGALAALFVIVAKWALIGRYRAGEQPLWSSWVFRNELVTSLHENLAEPMFLSWAAGTPLVAMFFRALGAKIGKRVTLQSTWLTEYDLVTIGDDVCLDEDCTLQTHLFEDRVMKLSSVRLERGVSVGMDAVVLYDSCLEAGSTLGAQSLVMKGETLPAATCWEGIPAQRTERLRRRESDAVGA